MVDGLSAPASSSPTPGAGARAQIKGAASHTADRPHAGRSCHEGAFVTKKSEKKDFVIILISGQDFRIKEILKCSIERLFNS